MLKNWANPSYFGYFSILTHNWHSRPEIWIFTALYIMLLCIYIAMKTMFRVISWNFMFWPPLQYMIWWKNYTLVSLFFILNLKPFWANKHNLWASRWKKRGILYLVSMSEDPVNVYLLEKYKINPEYIDFNWKKCVKGMIF